jgi:hypothetical protein
MTALVRTLIASHAVVFVAGVYVGKSIDADELDLYRSAHESTLTKILRKAQVVGIGALAVGSLIVAVKVVAAAKIRQKP